MGRPPPTPTPPDLGLPDGRAIHDVPLKQLANCHKTPSSAQTITKPVENPLPPLFFSITQPEIGKNPEKHQTCLGILHPPVVFLAKIQNCSAISLNFLHKACRLGLPANATANV